MKKNIGHKILIIESTKYSLEAVHYNIAFGMDYYDEIHIIGRYHRSYADIDVKFFSIPYDVYCPIAFHIISNLNYIANATQITYLAENVIIPYRAEIETDDGLLFTEDMGTPIYFSSFIVNPFVLIEDLNYINSGRMVPALDMMYSTEKHDEIDKVLGGLIISKVCLAYFGYGFFTRNVYGLIQASKKFVEGYKEMLNSLGRHIGLFWHILLSNIGPISEEPRTPLLALWGGYDDQKLEIMHLLSRHKREYFDKLRSDNSY
ncbi:MAG: hypothetical protein KatS3mg083_525 [Candidatus Dojkabacteria bacterium]|nr:MAG: hypothetical protein KatS3mg083_525 [Candidatus Dojkabacteria bacterium]